MRLPYNNPSGSSNTGSVVDNDMSAQRVMRVVGVHSCKFDQLASLQIGKRLAYVRGERFEVGVVFFG